MDSKEISTQMVHSSCFFCLFVSKSKYIVYFCVMKQKVNFVVVLLTLILLLTILTACNNRLLVERQLSMVDSLIYSNPDAALKRLDSLGLYINNKEEFVRLQVENNRMQLWAKIFLPVLVGMGCVFAWKICQYKTKVRAQNRECERLRKEYEETVVKCEGLERGNAELLKKQLDKAKDLLEYIITKNGPIKMVPKSWVCRSSRVQEMHIMAKEGRCLHEECWEDVVAEMVENDHDFLAWLDSHMELLNDREHKLCILVRLHFVPSEMSALLSTSKQNVTNMRTRLLAKLFRVDGNPHDFDVLIRMM